MGKLPSDALPDARSNKEGVAILYLPMDIQFLLKANRLTSSYQTDFIQKLILGIL